MVSRDDLIVPGPMHRVGEGLIILISVPTVHRYQALSSSAAAAAAAALMIRRRLLDLDSKSNPWLKDLLLTKGERYMYMNMNRHAEHTIVSNEMQ